MYRAQLLRAVQQDCGSTAGTGLHAGPACGSCTRVLPVCRLKVLRASVPCDALLCQQAPARGTDALAALSWAGSSAASAKVHLRPDDVVMYNSIALDPYHLLDTMSPFLGRMCTTHKHILGAACSSSADASSHSMQAGPQSCAPCPNSPPQHTPSCVQGIQDQSAHQHLAAAVSARPGRLLPRLADCSSAMAQQPTGRDSLQCSSGCIYLQHLQQHQPITPMLLHGLINGCMVLPCHAQVR